ncbi:FAD-binding domain-containing protein [Xylariaceae sp. AK1471]|nr:FAD-binding domain-containing protein [Xylariaceae sp. AK1471]
MVLLCLESSTIKSLAVTLLSLCVFFATASNTAQTVLLHHNDFNAEIETEIADHYHEVHLDSISRLRGPRPLIDCETTCHALRVLYPDLLIARDTRDEDQQDAYANFTHSYWSNQQVDVSPRCVFSPRRHTEVSVYVLVSRLTQCPFAVRGGGHASFAGASSIADGTVIALRHMDEIEVITPAATTSNSHGLANNNASSNTVIKVGAGSRWGDVYSTLEKSNTNITVVGGRDANVGVSGLLLGGGLSYFSNLYGFACDNVLAFEVVLASGRVVVARPGPDQEFADLYWALRGGGNNFGIVTVFHLAAFPLPKGLIWGGALTVQDPEAFVPLLGAFYHVGTGTSSAVGDRVEGTSATGSQSSNSTGHIDGRASQILAFVHINGSLAASVMLQYTQPVETLPSVFTEYMSILGKAWRPPADPPLSPQHSGAASAGAFSNRSLVDLTEMLSQGQPPGRRNMYRTATFKLNLLMAQYATEMFDLMLRAGPTVDIANLFPVLMLQIISNAVLRNTRKNGGNPLGLEGDEPRLLVAIVVSWSDAADDEKVDAMTRQFIDCLRDMAGDELCDCGDKYIYMNYASQDQGVLASYGSENLRRLKQIAEKYDPNKVFQRLLPGYHKL